MADFVQATFQASRALGGPHRLALSLGIEPDTLYRWIAGQDLPAEGTRRDLQRRITLALVAVPEELPVQRRHGDRN